MSLRNCCGSESRVSRGSRYLCVCCIVIVLFTYTDRSLPMLLGNSSGVVPLNFICNNVHVLYFTEKEMSNDDSPAYTFDYNTIPSRRIDIDLVPCFRISGWPPIAKLIDPTWLSQSKVVNDAVKCYDIVCKTCPEGNTNKCIECQ